MNWPWARAARKSARIGGVSVSNLGSWLLEALGGPVSASGARVGEREALGLTPFIAGVSLLAGDIAKTPLLVYERGAPEAVGVESFTHPLHRLLNIQANPWQTAFAWKEQVTAQLLVFGKHYSVIWRDAAGAPNGLYPLHPRRVQTWMGPGGSLFYAIHSGNLFEKMIAAGQPPLIPAENILTVQGTSLDGFEGLYPLSLARDSLGMALSAERHAAKLFCNGARLSGVLEKDGVLSAEAAARIKASWESLYAGTENAHRVALLEDGLKFKALGMTAADAQLLESRKFQAEEIARLLHIPPHKLGMLDRATFSNVEQQQIDYVTGVLATLAGRIESALEATLLRPDEIGRVYIDFDFSNLLRGDLETITEAAARVVLAGILTPNEARRWLRRPPLPEGDRLYPPPNTAGPPPEATPVQDIDA